MQKKTILLINGSQELMDITKKILERAGYTVQCAVGGRTACDLLDEFVPDGIVLENDLSDVVGVEYCRELRKKLAIPIMIISKNKDDELHAFRAGASDFLKKPFDYEIFKARIYVMLKQKSTEQIKKDAKVLSAGKICDDTMVGQKKLRLKKLWSIKKNYRKYVAAASCLLILLLGVGVAVILNRDTDYFLNDEFTPLANLPIDENDNQSQIDICISVPNIKTITVFANSSEIEPALYNPQENKCPFTYKIYLPGGDEPIFTSELIYPGEKLGRIKFDGSITRGSHDAVLKIFLFCENGIVVKAVTEMPVTIVIF